MKITKILAAMIPLLVLPLMMAAHAGADDNFAKKHPRRAQVLRKDQRLKNKTAQALKAGKIKADQAQKLEGQEAAIKAQAQADAAAHGGHITKVDQRELNREENRVRGELHRDVRKDARAAMPAAPAAPAAPTLPAAPAMPAAPSIPGQ